MDLKAEFHRTLPRAGTPDAAAANALVAVLRAEADTWLDGEQVPHASRAVEVAALMRYEGQGGELAVPWTGEAGPAVGAFHVTHRALYGFSLDAPVELVTLRVEASGKVPAPATAHLPARTMPAPVGRSLVHFVGGTQDTPVLERGGLGAGAAFDGPAVVTQLDATTLVPPGWRVEVEAGGSMMPRRSH